MSTLRDKILTLKRRYKYTSKKRYFYNRQSDLRLRTNKIISWSIVESKKKGVFIFEFPFIRRKDMSVDEWGKLWTKGSKRGYKSLYNILIDDVLTNISLKYIDDWKFVDLIGWTSGKPTHRYLQHKAAWKRKRKGTYLSTSQVRRKKRRLRKWNI